MEHPIFIQSSYKESKLTLQTCNISQFYDATLRARHHTESRYDKERKKMHLTNLCKKSDPVSEIKSNGTTSQNRICWAVSLQRPAFV